MSNSIHTVTVGNPNTTASTAHHSELGNPLPRNGSGLDWFTVVVVLIAVAILGVKLGRVRQKRDERDAKLNRLIDKMEREEAAIVRAAVNAQQADLAAHSSQPSQNHAKPSDPTVYKAPPPVASAAPAAHASASGSSRNLMAKQPAGDSLESAVAIPTQDEFGDTSRPYVASVNGQISQDVLEEAARHFSSMSPA